MSEALNIRRVASYSLLLWCQSMLVTFSCSYMLKYHALQHNWPNDSDVSTMAVYIWLHFDRSEPLQGRTFVHSDGNGSRLQKDVLVCSERKCEKETVKLCQMFKKKNVQKMDKENSIYQILWFWFSDDKAFPTILTNQWTFCIFKYTTFKDDLRHKPQFKHQLTPVLSLYPSLLSYQKPCEWWFEQCVWFKSPMGPGVFTWWKW